MKGAIRFVRAVFLAIRRSSAVRVNPSSGMMRPECLVTIPEGERENMIPAREGEEIMFPEGVTEIMIGEENPCIPEGEMTFTVPAREGEEMMFPEGVTEIMIGEENPCIPEGEMTFTVPARETPG